MVFLGRRNLFFLVILIDTSRYRWSISKNFSVVEINPHNPRYCTQPVLSKGLADGVLQNKTPCNPQNPHRSRALLVLLLRQTDDTVLPERLVVRHERSDHSLWGGGAAHLQWW